MCGDDLDIEPDPDSIRIAKQYLQYDCINVENWKTFHPGVLLAVSEEVPQHANYGGFWIAQKHGETFERVSLD